MAFKSNLEVDKRSSQSQKFQVRGHVNHLVNSENLILFYFIKNKKKFTKFFFKKNQ